MNRIFLPDNALLDRIPTIRDLPCVVVQGRYDMVCPLTSADELIRAWPGADYVVIQDAGHSAMEPGIKSALVDATQGFKRRLR